MKTWLDLEAPKTGGCTLIIMMKRNEIIHSYLHIFPLHVFGLMVFSWIWILISICQFYQFRDSAFVVIIYLDLRSC